MRVLTQAVVSAVPESLPEKLKAKTVKIKIPLFLGSEVQKSRVFLCVSH